MNMGSIIRQKRKALNLTLQQVGDVFGITRSAVASWERGDTRPDQDRLTALARLLKTSTTYLLTGDKQHDRPGLHLPALSKMRDEQNDLDLFDVNVVAGPDIKGKLPLISWVQAGNWTEVVDNFQPGDAEDWIPCPFRHGRNAFVLKVVGESNYDPTGPKSYSSGDYIAVDPSREPINRSMVVVRVDHEDRATFKQLLIEEDGTMLLKALNPSWPNRVFEMPPGSRIVGVVIGKWIPE